MDTKKINALTLERDFNSRLQSGEFSDLETYKEFVKGKSKHFTVEILRDEVALRKIEADYYKSLAGNREPPRKMRELLDEYIAANKLKGKYNPLDLIEDLERNEDRERRMPDSDRECNPYRGML